MYRPAKARLRAEGLGVDEGQATPDDSPLIPDLLSANLAAIGGDTSMYDDESGEGSRAHDKEIISLVSLVWDAGAAARDAQ